MANLIAAVILVIAAVLQNTIITRINLLAGAADLVLLVMLAWVLHIEEKNLIKYGLFAGGIIGVSSVVPFWIPLLSYSLVCVMVSILKSRIWEAPYWMLLTSAFIGTIIVYGFDIIVMWVLGYPFDFGYMINNVILPSTVLDILFALPVYLFVGEVTKLVYPEEVQV